TFANTALFGPEDSGNQNQVIIYRTYPGEEVVFTSGIHVTGWKKIDKEDPGYVFLPSRKARRRVVVAPIPAGLGVIRHMADRHSDWLEVARINVTDWVNTEKWVHGYSVEGQMWDPPEEKTVCTFSRSLEGLSNEDAALSFSIYTADFEWLVLPVRSIEDSILTTQTPGGHRLALPEEGQYHGSHDLAFIHNVLEGIDEPGKWACNTRTGLIYLWPRDRTDAVYVPLLKSLVHIEGLPRGRKAWFSKDPVDPIRYLVFDGITFTNCRQPVFKRHDVTTQHDWAMLDKNNALLRFRGSEQCVIRNCTFKNSGGAGIRFDLYAQHNRLENCTFSNLGHEAVHIGGYGIGIRDENHHNSITGNEFSHVCRNHWYGAVVVLWNTGFNLIRNNFFHHFASRAVLLSAPRSRAFTKNNQVLFPLDRTMHEQAWPMARWDEIPDSALATVIYRGIEGEEVRSVKVGLENLQTRGPDQDRPCSHFRFSRGNVIQHNVICHGAQNLFADALFYITATAFGEPNQIIENYIYETGNHLPHPNIPFRLIYIDGFSGDFVFARNFAFDSRFRFEVVAPYAWWGQVDNRSNIFYRVKAEEEEYFGTDNGFGNICVRYGPNDPQKESLADYNRMLNLLESNDWPGPGPLPGSKKIQKKLKKIIKSIK
ncbi:right-handed parallel beta-helix repeat-containing protein, partial [bacterium]